MDININIHIQRRDAERQGKGSKIRHHPSSLGWRKPSKVHKENDRSHKTEFLFISVQKALNVYIR